MKINLDTTVFNLSEVVPMIERQITLRHKSGMLVKFPDFGSIVVGNPSNEDIELFLQPGEGEPIFVAPSTWRMPNLLKALGAFSSISAAIKNGHDKDIPDGFTQILLRINRVKGVVTILKIL